MKPNLLLVFLLVSLFITTPVIAAELNLPEGALKRKEVKKLFTDRTVNTITAKKGQLAVSYYSDDGEVLQQRKGKKRLGHWRVTKNGRLCVQMEGYREKCRIIVKEAGTYKKYIVKKNGQHQHTLTYISFSKGNSHGL